MIFTLTGCVLISKIRCFGLVWEDSPQKLGTCPCWTLLPETKSFTFKKLYLLNTKKKQNRFTFKACHIWLQLNETAFLPSGQAGRSKKKKKKSCESDTDNKLQRYWAFFFPLNLCSVIPVYFSLACSYILCNILTKVLWQLTHDAIRLVRKKDIFFSQQKEVNSYHAVRP